MYCACAAPAGTTTQTVSRPSTVARIDPTRAADMYRSQLPTVFTRTFAARHPSWKAPFRWVRYFSPLRILLLLRVFLSCGRPAPSIGETCSSPVPQVAHSTRHGDRHIPCRRSAQHAEDPYRDTVDRSRTLCRAHRPTSTTFRLK